MLFFIKRQNILIASSLWLFNLNVFATPNIQLSTHTITGGEKMTLTATGGTPPYLWLTEAGSLKISDTHQAELTAPQVAGTFSITLLDSQNKRTTTEFSVVWQRFSVTPEYVYLEPGDSVTFGLHGVTGNVQVIEEAGNLEPLSETAGVGFRYTAPDQPGFYAIIFYQTDNPNDTRLAHVKVFPPFEAVAETVFLEDYETTFLQVKGGVPPYLWIEGGKGKLEVQREEGDKVRYVPGNIIGQETITVYDRTGNSVNILVTVKGHFRISTIRHSICLGNAIVKFIASGGEPPYTLSPPKQDGWYKIAHTDNKLTLKFTQSDFFEIVGSDNAGKTAISSISIDAFCDQALKLNPSEPIYRLVHKDGRLPALSVSIEDTASGAIEWMCIGLCSIEDLNVFEGKIITFIPPDLGHYELSAQDQSGRTGTVEIHIGDNLLSLYSGADNKLEAFEIQRALDDFFKPHFCCNRTEFYQLLQQVTY